MKFTNRSTWKRILLAVVCLIGLLAIAGGSYAAYTSQAFQRGVVRNQDNETMRFTSNYLQGCAGETEENAYPGRTVIFSSDQKKPGQNLKVDITIYNYANGNTNLVSQKDITYNLTIKLSGGDGIYTVKYGEQSADESSGNTYIFKNQTLTGRTPNSRTYTVTFPGTDLDKLRITAEAKPTLLSVTNNQKLAAVIAPCVGSTVQTFTASGEFIDMSAKPIEYRGFNYEISISSGQADVKLAWDNKVLEIDTFFLKNLGKTDDEIKKILADGELAFEMDQQEGKGDYLIPFYIRDISKIPDTGSAEKDWAEMKKMITFTATQKNVTQNQT